MRSCRRKQPGNRSSWFPPPRRPLHRSGFIATFRSTVPYETTERTAHEEFTCSVRASELPKHLPGLPHRTPPGDFRLPEFTSNPLSASQRLALQPFPSSGNGNRPIDRKDAKERRNTHGFPIFQQAPDRPPAAGSCNVFTASERRLGQTLAGLIASTTIEGRAHKRPTSACPEENRLCEGNVWENYSSRRRAYSIRRAVWEREIQAITCNCPSVL
jgi:hypothetical protein